MPSVINCSFLPTILRTKILLPISEVDNLYWLDQILIDSYPYHDRAFYLSQLLNQGYPVVKGLIVPWDVLWQYLEVLGESELLLADLQDSDLHLDVHQPQQLRAVAQKLRQKILQGQPPSAWLDALAQPLAEISTPFVVLQPFLQHELFPAPAAILETVICPAQPAAVLAGLQQAWGQLFRAHHLFCWRQAKLKLSQVNLAVLIQPLGETIASGTVTAHGERLEIEATWGLPLTLDRGEVLPDSYTINSPTKSLLQQRLGSKTRAYRLAPHPLDSPSDRQASPPENPHENQQSSSLALPYVLSLEEQESYSLTEENLEHLTQLCTQLQETGSPNFHLAWQIFASEQAMLPHLTITAFTPQPSAKHIPHLSLSWRGLGVAKGEVTAQAQVLLDSRFFRYGRDRFANRPSPELWLPSAETHQKYKGDRHPNPEEQGVESLNLEGKILVTAAVLPEWVPFLKQVVGIITEQGGMTSHGAIIARELGIPAVVGVPGATQSIHSGEYLTLNGNQGKIYQATGDLPAPRELARELAQELGRVPIDRPLSIPTNYLHATKLLVNLSQPQGIPAAASLPVDGVGLLRSELILAEILQNHHLRTFQEIVLLGEALDISSSQASGQHSGENLRQSKQQQVITALADIITEFAQAFAPRPVFYRSADWRSGEFPDLFGTESSGANPVLGNRGTFRYTQDPQLFNWELAALREVQHRGYDNISLLLPFVRTVEEFSFCRRRVQQMGLLDQPQFQLWIMAEVPSVIFLLEDYVRAGVQGVSIGSNDLTQLILGCDRDQAGMANLNAAHPAVLGAMQQIITTARKLQIPCSICGQAPVNYPELIEQLVTWGITSISVEVSAVAQVQRSLFRAEQKLLLELARSSRTKEIPNK